MSEICEDIRLSQIDKYGEFVRQYDHFGCSIFIIFSTDCHNISSYNRRGVPRIWQVGKPRFFSDLKSCMSHMLRMAKSCALLRGLGSMPPPREIFFKWCNLVRFGVYFDQILSLKFF